MSVLQELQYKTMSDNIEFRTKQKKAYGMMVRGESIFLTGPAGTGKSLSFDTPVIMYDGTIKMVQDIQEGELVMGDDSTSREVLATTSGEDEMYRVTTAKGDHYDVNSRHNLTFQVSKTFEYLGCSVAYFRNHIASQFKEGMSWDNYGEWHIDHIIPIKLEPVSPENITRRLHWTNTQPMWAEENMAKSNLFVG